MTSNQILVKVYQERAVVGNCPCVCVCVCVCMIEMARKYSDSIHEEAMVRLCFVCADLIKGKPFEVEKHCDLISRALRTPEVFLIPGVTPQHFCKKCELAMKHVVSGKSINSSRVMQEWGECGENCSSCKMVSSKKAFGGGCAKKVW